MELCSQVSYHKHLTDDQLINSQIRTFTDVTAQFTIQLFGNVHLRLHFAAFPTIELDIATVLCKHTALQALSNQLCGHETLLLGS